MRIWLGALALRVDTRVVAEQTRRQMPRALFQTRGLTPSEEAMRLAAKALTIAALPMLRAYVKTHFPGFPAPNPPKRADRLAYMSTYLLALIAAAADSAEWRAEYEEESDGAILITDLAPVAPAPALAAPSAAAAGPEPPPAGEDLGGYPREPGRSLVHPRDDGHGEIHVRGPSRSGVA